MYKLVLRSMPDAATFAVVAFVIFFVFFLMLGIWVWRMDKGQVLKMSELPLRNDSTSPQNRT